MSNEEPLKCGTFKDAEPLGPVVRVGRDLWKQIREERAAALRDVERLREALSGILGIGKRDMTNPKYDGYFDDAKEALAATDRNQQKEAEDATR